MGRFAGKHLSAPLLALLLVAGCSDTTTSTAEDDGLKSPPDRLPQTTSECGFGGIHDWRAIDRYRLVVWFTNSKIENARLIELSSPCDGLRFANTIAFDTRDRFRVCSFGGDAVIVDGRRCSIGRISLYDPQKHRISDRDGESPDEEEGGAETPADDEADER